MSLDKTIRLSSVKARRADMRMAEVQRCRRELREAELALAEAQAAVEKFKRERQETTEAAYAAIRGEDLSELDLRKLNARLERLVEQERNLVTRLGSFHLAIVHAQEDLKQASFRYQAARRNSDKWQAMLKPMRKAAARGAERNAEIERDDQSAIQRKPVF